MVILARDDSSFLSYLTAIKSPLKNRFNDYNNFSKIQGKLFEKLRNGSLAHVNHKYIMIFILLIMKEYYNEKSYDNYEEIIDQLHISKEEGGSEPYFINLFNLDKDIENDLKIT